MQGLFGKEFRSAMSSRSRSLRWLKEHSSDPYVKLARQGGFRSRAAFKLIEINAREQILKPGMTVIDLGAAPGGWSQVAAAAIGPQGRLIAVDVLPMIPLKQVIFIQGDVCEEAVVRSLLDILNNKMADLVLSDMAPNISGTKVRDQAQIMHLAERVVECAIQVLRPGGSLLVKLFQGEGIDAYLKQLSRLFLKVYTRKPRASRGRSAEIYVIAHSYGV
jgi:23S rRNA (uridine2552-2'-O)-methyltransferase